MTHNDAWSRTLAELSFEQFGHTMIAVTSDAALATYSHCLHTALVVDFGWSCLRIVPVIESHPRTGAIRVHPIGGYGLTRVLAEQLQRRHICVAPSGDGTESQRQQRERRKLVELIQTSCSYAANTIDEDFLCFVQGRPVDIQFEMQLIAAIHFTELGEDDQVVYPIAQLVKQAIDDCPDDAKRELWDNIVTSGGFSQLPSFLGKLQTEVKKVADPVFDVCVRYPMTERCGGRHAVWTGGSIFASSSVFPKFCVQKEEWEEHGEAILRTKCV
jgi:actin-related protein